MGTFFAGDLKTGLIRVRNIPVQAGSGAEPALNAAGSIAVNVSLPMRDPETQIVLPFSDLVVPGRSFIGYEEGGVIKECGPVWVDDFDVDSRVLRVSAAGLRSYYDYRFILPVLTGAQVPLGRKTLYTNMSLPTIAKRLIQQAHAWTDGAVPVVFESDIAGTQTREYLGEDMHKIEEVLTQLSGVENGPDIQFVPQFAEDPQYVQWLLRTGSPEITQAGPDHIWDTTVINPSVKGTKYVRDGRSLVTHDWEMGMKDPAKNPKTRSASTPAPKEVLEIMAGASDDTLLDVDYPMFEKYTNRSSVKTLAVLQEHAAEEVFMGRFHGITWEFQSKVNKEPMARDVSVGDYGKIKVKDLYHIPDGDHEVRVMRIKYDADSQFATYYCAPKRART